MPQLLALLSLQNTLVTADAMHCQLATAAQSGEQQGDYVLALKANQGTLHADVRHLLDESPPPVTTHMTVKKT